MSNKNLSIDLTARKDVDGNIFYVGKLEFPGTINLKDGAVFLVFISDKGNEQLQIGPMEKNNLEK